MAIEFTDVESIEAALEWLYESQSSIAVHKYAIQEEKEHLNKAIFGLEQILTKMKELQGEKV